MIIKDNNKALYIWNSCPETKRSSSAGAFYLIAKEFLKKFKDNATVYGCAFDENNVAKHIRIQDIENLKSLQGSKYVQSNMRQTFQRVLADLTDGKNVLFSGTSCQTAAIRKYIGSNNDRLYTIDTLCHGVPSPILWKKYVSEIEKKYKGKISDIRFRNKSSRNRMGYMLKFKVNGTEKTVFPDESWYYSSFLQGTSLRPSCYKCPFVAYFECSDLTIGDSNTKYFHPTEAVSLLLIRNEKGWKMFNLIIDVIEHMEADIEEESNINRKLVESTHFPDDRLQFYKVEEHEVNTGNKYRNWAVNRIKNLMPTVIKDLIKR